MSQMKAVQDPLLSNVSNQLLTSGFIADSLFPSIPVMQSTGKLGSYGKDHLRIEQNLAGGQGQYRRVVPNVRTTTGYSIEGHGLEGMVTKYDYKNVQQPFEAEQDEVIGLTSLLQVEKEYSLAATLADTAVLTSNTTLSGSSQLSDYSNSDPIGVFSTARASVKNGCGLQADTAFMDSRVADKLRFHPAILDALGFKENRPGGLTDEELAKAMYVKRVLVADCDYNSAKEGQTDSLAAIWGKHIWFGVLPMVAMKRQVSAGYKVVFAGEAPRKVYKYSVNNPPESTGILVEDNYDMLLSNVSAMYLIKSAIA